MANPARLRSALLRRIQYYLLTRRRIRGGVGPAPVGNRILENTEDRLLEDGTNRILEGS